MAYVSMDKPALRIVELVSFLGVYVKVNTGNDINACLTHPLGHTSPSAKEIYRYWHSIS